MNAEQIKSQIDQILIAQQQIDWIIRGLEVDAPEVAEILKSIFAPRTEKEIKNVMKIITDKFAHEIVEEAEQIEQVSTWYTIAQFMEAIGCKRTKAYKILRDHEKYGLLVCNSGARFRVRPDTVQDFIKKHMV